MRPSRALLWHMNVCAVLVQKLPAWQSQTAVFLRGVPPCSAGMATCFKAMLFRWKASRKSKNEAASAAVEDHECISDEMSEITNEEKEEAVAPGEHVMSPVEVNFQEEEAGESWMSPITPSQSPIASWCSAIDTDSDSERPAPPGCPSPVNCRLPADLPPGPTPPDLPPPTARVSLPLGLCPPPVKWPPPKQCPPPTSDVGSQRCV